LRRRPAAPAPHVRREARDPGTLDHPRAGVSTI
jgi:hypothetical protein